MTDPYHQRSHGEQLVTGKSVLYGSLAGVAMGGTLFGMMGFSFLATLTLLLISSPLMLIFSPPLLFAAFVFVGTLAGFGTALAMAFAGVSTLAWSYREVMIGRHLGLELGGEERDNFGGYLQQGNQPQQHEEESRLIEVE